MEAAWEEVQRAQYDTISHSASYFLALGFVLKISILVVPSLSIKQSTYLTLTAFKMEQDNVQCILSFACTQDVHDKN